MDALQSVGDGVDGVLILVPVLACGSVPFVTEGEFVAVDARTSEQVYHPRYNNTTQLSYCHQIF